MNLSLRAKGFRQALHSFRPVQGHSGRWKAREWRRPERNFLFAESSSERARSKLSARKLGAAAASRLKRNKAS